MYTTIRISVKSPVPSFLPLPLALETSERPLAVRGALPFFEASKGSSQAGADGEKDKGKGKRKKLSVETKDAVKDREATVKAKEVEAKTQEADPKAKDAPTSQPSQKENPSAPDAKV